MGDFLWRAFFLSWFALIGAAFAMLIVTIALSVPRSPSDLARGRCIGWAEAQGLVAAWDEDGACVLGTYAAEVDGE